MAQPPSPPVLPDEDGDGVRLVTPFWIIHITSGPGGPRAAATRNHLFRPSSRTETPVSSPSPTRSPVVPRTLSRRTRVAVGLVAALVVLGALLLANWTTSEFGFIPVGFGLESTAGTLFAGVMLAGRDAVQDALGRWAVVVLIAFGTALSFAIAAPSIALASAAAFAFGELLDFAVYTPIRSRARFGDRRWALAVIASNVVGAVADTVIFLTVAFGAATVLPALGGQLVGKGWATIAYLLIGVALAAAWRAWRNSHPVPPAPYGFRNER